MKQMFVNLSLECRVDDGSGEPDLSSDFKHDDVPVTEIDHAASCQVTGEDNARQWILAKDERGNVPELLSLTMTPMGNRSWCDSRIYQARQTNAAFHYRTVQPNVPDRNTGFLSAQNAEWSTDNHRALAG